MAGRLHRIADVVTAALLYAMVVFAPWAFGTTQPWAIWTMNAAGYCLGALLVVKWLARRSLHRATMDQEPPRTALASSLKNAERTAQINASPFVTTLAVLTVLILLYTLIYAVNARATYLDGFNRFEYYDSYITWLPHTYDKPSTWFAFWLYLGLACFFWSTRDWLGGHRAEGGRRDLTLYALSTERLTRLLWVMSINAALVAVVGILQRLSGTGKLLWLVEPTINKAPTTFFGPYAYRATASLYLNMVWPVALALWWSLHRAYRAQNPFANLTDGSHHALLVCALLIAASPIVTTSRGGSFIVAGLTIATLGIFWFRKRRGLTLQLGIFALVIGMLGFGAYLGWDELKGRLQQLEPESFDRAVPGSRAIAEDYPWFGTGPETFEEVYNLYRPGDTWEAYTHNDWLETRITFGWIGTGFILLAFLCIPGRWLLQRWREGYWPTFDLLFWLAVGGCLVHSFFDFPFQIYSTLFYFLLLLVILEVRSERAAT